MDISEIVGRSGEVAGAWLARFGGFFAERTRGHDFLLGYRNGLIWMWNNLERAGLDRTRDDRGARPGDDDPRLDRRSRDARAPVSAAARRCSASARVSFEPVSASGWARGDHPCGRDGSATVAAGNGGAWALPERFHDGRYRTLRQLGSGASKRVVVAYDDELEREVAVAVIRSADLSDGERARLLREVRVTAQLCSHPNILTVHDAGEQGEFTYVVLELVEGGSVAGRLATRPSGCRSRSRCGSRATSPRRSRSPTRTA